MYKTYKLIIDSNLIGDPKIKEMETFLQNVYSLNEMNTQSDIFTIGIVSKCENIFLYINIKEEYQKFFEKKIAAVENSIQMEEWEDPLEQLNKKYEDGNMFVNSYSLVKEDNDKTKKLKNKDVGNIFLNNLINSMKNDEDEVSIVEFTLKPFKESKFRLADKLKNSDMKKIAMGTINVGMRGLETVLDTFVMNGQLKNNSTKSTENKIDNNKKGKSNEINEEVDNILFCCDIKVISLSNNLCNAIQNTQDITTTFSLLNDKNKLTVKKNKFKDIFCRNTVGNIMTTSELSQFINLPSRQVNADNFEVSNCRKIYDRNIPQTGIVFGDSNSVPIAFPAYKVDPNNYEQMCNGPHKDFNKVIDNLMKPKMVLGQQGTGKSEFIINLAIRTAELGFSLIIVDPKNDTQQRIIESLPDHMLDRLDYINFGDTEYPPGMNLFRKRKGNDATENSLIVSSFLALMKKEFSKSWGIKIQRTLQMTAETILLDEVHTLNEFELMLTERCYREYMIQKLHAILEETKSGKAHIRKLIKYWQIFNAKSDEAIAKEVEPVMNQLGVFLSNRVIKAIVSQREGYDFRKAADTGRIVIINIPEGILGDNAKLLSSIINKSIWLDLQSRADIPLAKRYPTMWIIDEAHEIVDDEFKGVLTKARAYRLGLTLVTQGMSNFNMRGMGDIADTLMTNCKNKITFRMGISDCRSFGDEFAPLTFSDLNNCPDYHFYCKMIMKDGSISNAFFGHAPFEAPKVRDYYKFLEYHRSGRFKVDEIEDEIENRLDAIKVMNNLCKYQ